MKIISVVGARPQFVKLAPIDKQMHVKGIEHVIVHTGQHYDPLLSQSFFQELGISQPKHQLNVGSATHGAQTGEMLIKLEKIFQEENPDWVLVYGDTNSTIAAALAAVKLQIRVAHLEAGLRSFNRSMPEEHNRVVTDHVSDLLLAPTQIAMQHLATEGLAAKAINVGDVMTDILYVQRDAVANAPIPVPSKTKEYYIATIHRPQNTDDPQRLQEILKAFSNLDYPVYLLAHPRLKAVMENSEITSLWPQKIADTGSLKWCDALPYPKLVRAVMSAKAVITDSGGLQKEAFLLQTPCITVRSETEWEETIELGWNRLVEPGIQIIQATQEEVPAFALENPYGNGDTARLVVQTLLEF
ncbi:MAG: UDP-N-acetylglucosamine 2-epimerase (non-hydrolyzing) [Arcanobacterium sp.]|nr:UDP-N-acetylglucosamine 2-epimerase (non-hydrolyzing) [Arcanobacterium sp.]